MIDLTMFLFGKKLRSLTLWIRKAVEYFEWGLMGHPSRNLGDSGAETDLDSGGLAHEGSEENDVTMVPIGEECGCFLPLF